MSDDIKIFRTNHFFTDSGTAGLSGPETAFRKPILTPESIGTEAIGMALFVLPAGQRTKPHVHAADSHTAIYVIQGSGTSHVGEQGQNVHRTHPGDVIYIPPGVKHYKINDGEEPIVAAVFRTNIDSMQHDQHLES